MKKNLQWLLIGSTIFLLIMVGMSLLLSQKPTTQQTKNLASPTLTPSLLPTPELPSVIFTLNPAAKAIREGEVFKIDVVLESEEIVLAVDLDITYDSGLLKLEKIEPGDFFDKPMQFSKSINESQGKIFYALGSLSPSPKSGKASVATLTFKSKANSERTQITLLGDKTLVSVKGDKRVNIILPMR